MTLDARLSNYALTIEGLHSKWKPHPGQVKAGQALLRDGMSEVFVQAGRNWGKTDLVGYLVWRWARTRPGSENYYFAPYMKQAREILWSSQRLQGFGPREWISAVNNTEMRITFTNGSFIKLDGSDNVEAYRGVKPRGLIVFDEFKDFRPEFFEAFDPNRAAHKAPLLIIGTPPDRDCQFTEVAEEFKRNPRKAFFTAPTEENPYIEREWIENKKRELYARNEGDVWEREYMANFVKGGVCKIFPMLTQATVKPYHEIMDRLRRDLKKLDLFAWADPAAATCFAVLFLAVNPYTKDVIALDEIYETEQRAMTTRQIGTRIFKARDEIYNRKEWRLGYDEAETWFANEMLDNFDEYFEPSHKAANDKDVGLSLIKDMMLAGRFTISDRCKKLYWEMDNYFKDKNGKIPKKDDHLIDCLRYTLAAANYELKEKQEYKEELDEDFRGERLPERLNDIDDLEEYA